MKGFAKIAFLLLSVFLTACVGVKKSLNYTPDLSLYETIKPVVQKKSDSLFTTGTNFLTRNKYGQWELYVEGNPMERGAAIGALLDTLLYKQEGILFDKVKTMIPSERKQRTILSFVRWYNRKLYKHVPEELQVEIYGISQYCTDKYDYIAPKFMRNLYLHGAHDIGHALVDLSLIGCTSSALWGEETEDGTLLIGRNLDFHLNDEFAEEKVIYFVKPTTGIPFASISWPGFVGVVSGMNKEGLTVTMNAGKSKIPLIARTPISIVARDILQNASTIDEAIAIARKSKVFVSESLMIGSAKDGKAILIEMAPKKIGIYEIQNNRLVCSNHFQSEVYKKDKRNKAAIKYSHSQYRYERMNELLTDFPKTSPSEMAAILRNKEGLNNREIGYGNEKALNQLLAHHGVIFKPAEKIIWISSSPYQLGAFTGYNLDEIFAANRTTTYQPLFSDSLTIPADDFQETEAFANYQKYRELAIVVEGWLKNKTAYWDATILAEYQRLNPEMWSVYYQSGLLFYRAKKYAEAKRLFEVALQKEITTLYDRQNVQKMMRKTKKKAR